MTGAVALSVNYGLPPENPLPKPVNDIVDVYREIIARYRPESIAFIGESAGQFSPSSSVHRAYQVYLCLCLCVIRWKS